MARRPARPAACFTISPLLYSPRATRPIPPSARPGQPPSALTPPRAPILRPGGYQRVDFEGELCVVIGRRCRRVSEDEALSFLFGFTILNDVTVRDLQKKDVQFTRAKGFDSFAPVGPCIATGLDPANLRIRTRLNGQLRQDSSTSDLLFPVAHLVSYISRVMTLEPGD